MCDLQFIRARLQTRKTYTPTLDVSVSKTAFVAWLVSVTLAPGQPALVDRLQFHEEFRKTLSVVQLTTSKSATKRKLPLKLSASTSSFTLRLEDSNC